MLNPARTERITSEHDAAAWIQDGMTVALGEPYPMALIRQIARRRIRNLTVIASGLGLDVLIAAGCVKKAISYYAGGRFGVAVAPHFRRAVEAGAVEVWECEEGILTTGLEAAGKALPYLPWRGGIGSSIPDLNPDLKVIEDPIEGEPLIAVPAIKPDITILHAAHADAYGNVQHIGGPGWIDLFYHRAAQRTIVQVEKVISNEDVRGDPWATTIDNADAIVRAPYGAHPFYSRGYYVQDVAFVQTYLDASREASAAADEFLDRFVFEPETHGDYLERVGIKRLLDLYEY